MSIRNIEFRDKIDKSAHRSMCNPYTILSMAISTVATGLALYGVLNETKTPLYVSLATAGGNSILRGARLNFLYRYNRRLRHYFFADSEHKYTGNTKFNVKIEYVSFIFGPIVGVLLCVLGLSLLKGNPKSGEILSIIAPFSAEILSSIGESILETANAKLNHLNEIKADVIVKGNEPLLGEGEPDRICCQSFC